MADDSSLDADLPDATVRGMVDALRPDWRVESIDRIDEGTEFVAELGLRTPEGRVSAVLKVTTADLVDPEVARAEPRLLELVGAETPVPVPTVFGYRDGHPELPAPFSLLERATGENFEDRPGALPRAARERVVREAGANLAELHDLGPLPAAGAVGVRDGDLTVLDGDGHERWDDFREKALADCEDTLDALVDGGFFPDMADEPDRFADLVPRVREHVRATVPALPDPDPPTYCHWDYRYGNLLVDPETGATRAVLDWANLAATDPAYNLAKAELSLLTPEADGEARTAALRETFRTAYAASRADWAFDDAVRERTATYRLLGLLDDMACLPLWYPDREAREARAAWYREQVESSL